MGRKSKVSAHEDIHFPPSVLMVVVSFVLNWLFKNMFLVMANIRLFISFTAWGRKSKFSAHEHINFPPSVRMMVVPFVLNRLVFS